MAVDLLLGLQWGDEGKGKIVDVLTSKYDIIARFQGGPNAGHTLVFNEKKYVLNTIPSGIFHKEKINLIGNGVVIDPVILNKEIENIKSENVDISKTLFISRKAHLILPTHRLLDAASEKSKGKNKIGSTLKGIGPTYMDKTGRNGFRVGVLENDNWKLSGSKSFVINGDSADKVIVSARINGKIIFRPFLDKGRMGTAGLISLEGNYIFQIVDFLVI